MEAKPQKRSVKEILSSWFFRKSIDALNYFVEAKPTVSGLENLDELNEKYKGKVIIASPHETDLDIQTVAGVLMNNKDIRKKRVFDMKITHISQHDDLKKQIKTGNPGEIMIYFGLRLIGHKNFLPIDYDRDGSKWVSRPFNPKNAEAMMSVMRSDKNDILIAAYNPPDKDEKVTDRNPGMGAAYMSEMAGVPVLPIRLERGKDANGKKTLNVDIGKPIYPDETNIKQLEDVFERRSKGETIAHEDFLFVRKAFSIIKTKSEAILKSVLPASRP